MKSEERHKLLTNDLGVVTTKTVGFFERHLESVIAAVCAILVLGAVGFWWTRTTESDNASGWTALDQARNLQQFGEVSDKYPGTPPGQWAKLKIAEKTAQNAMPLMFSDRGLALTELKSAREGFESLVQDKTAPPVIRERALWGLALCLESASDGDTSKVIVALEQLLKQFPDTMFKPVAEERIAALKRNDAKEFYAWFSTENPKPKEARPDDFKAGGVNLPAPKSDDDILGDSAAVKEEASQSPPADQADAKSGDTPDDKGKSTDGPADKPETEKTPEPGKPADAEKPAEKPSP